jgi:predicted Zn-dependent protease
MSAVQSLATIPAQRPHLRLVPPPVPATVPARVRAQAAAAPVRLTRRGRALARLAAVVVLAAVGIGLMLLLTGAFGPAAAGTEPTAPATRVIVVQPGQTLWSIAAQVAPKADRRDTIARIVELNALANSSVSAGARIAVPTR